MAAAFRCRIWLLSEERALGTAVEDTKPHRHMITCWSEFLWLQFYRVAYPPRSSHFSVLARSARYSILSDGQNEYETQARPRYQNNERGFIFEPSNLDFVICVTVFCLVVLCVSDKIL